MSTNQNGFWTEFTSLDEIFAVEVQSGGGGGGRGVTITRFPYPIHLPPEPFFPFVSRLPHLVAFLPLSRKLKRSEALV